ncbi:hypothetical protein THAOC_30272, partial [Thalassiosira oceanica]
QLQSQMSIPLFSSRGQSAPGGGVGKVCSSSWILAPQMQLHYMCKMVNIAALFGGM